MVRVEGIPIWVTILAIVLAVVPIVVGTAVSLNPALVPGYVEGADGLTITWAGRTLGLGGAALLALYLRNAGAYTVVIFGALIREIIDIVYFINEFIGGAIGIAILLLIEVAAFIISLRAALRKILPTA